MLKTKHYLFISILFGIIAVAGSYLLAQQVGEVISDYGNNPRTALLYNTTLIISAVSLLAFTYKKIQDLGLRDIKALVLLLSASGPIMIALFPLGGSEIGYRIHWFGAAIMFFGYPISMLLLSSELRRLSEAAYIYSVSAGLISLLFLFSLWEFTQFRYIPQLMVLSLILIWNLLFSSVNSL